VHVSATNHGYRSADYLDQFPVAHVREIHLAGHATEQDSAGNPLLIDAHDRTVSEDVWSLYERFTRSHPSVPTLIEWDNDVPDWRTLKTEAKKADAIRNLAAQPMQRAS
jgi:uncharacterized protein (UPF0276 family)